MKISITGRPLITVLKVQKFSSPIVKGDNHGK